MISYDDTSDVTVNNITQYYEHIIFFQDCFYIFATLYNKLLPHNDDLLCSFASLNTINFFACEEVHVHSPTYIDGVTLGKC